MTSPSGLQSSLHDYAPFCAELTSIRQEPTAGFDREEPKQFTGHEREYTVGTGSENTNYLDYMQKPSEPKPQVP